MTKLMQLIRDRRENINGTRDHVISKEEQEYIDDMTQYIAEDYGLTVIQMHRALMRAAGIHI